MAAVGVPDGARLRFALAIAVEAGDALIKLAFRHATRTGIRGGRQARTVRSACSSGSSQLARQG